MLCRCPLAERDPERSAEYRRLDVVSGEAVAGEEQVDPTLSDHAGESRRRTCVDDGRTADGEHLTTRAVVSPRPRSARALA